jgi:pyruvate oxidase
MLAVKASKREDDSILGRLREMKHEWFSLLEREADAKVVPIRPPYIMKVLSECSPEDAIISLDVGENGWWFGRNFRIRRQRFAMSGYLGTLGFGLPGAIAAKLCFPDRKVLCITGDGGFQMAMGDLVTAVKYDLPMTVVVMDNHELGMIRVEQMMESYPNYGTDLYNPDYAAFARSCGAVGVSVERPEELRDAVEQAMGMDKVVVITDHQRFP